MISDDRTPHAYADPTPLFEPPTAPGFDTPFHAGTAVSAASAPPGDNELDAIAAEALAEFEALVDEIVAELAAHWDGCAKAAPDSLQFGAGEADNNSRDEEIRQYARELVAAAYVNQDNSVWDPADAQSYASGTQADALLPTLLSLTDEPGEASPSEDAGGADSAYPSSEPTVAAQDEPAADGNSVLSFVAVARC
ncbi:hypothetical protein FSO04_37340 [Paraburkholderia madseniana]|uniref:Uncharacterized protein n=1 Tax=Paraburkholderia madseniana TaxID=2599607 RepID=A0A6N6W3V2_9BURK|nr:hypothetical protein [Paraburkholderia madseniana]KAE8754891.1 hypothetical protein FSO04_37340 [Paraburkholderia madseniana]